VMLALQPVRAIRADLKALRAIRKVMFAAVCYP